MSEQQLIEQGRKVLEDWEAVDSTHTDFIGEARFRLSHNRWPKKTEGKLSFGFDYYSVPTAKSELSSLVDVLRECALYAQRAARKDVPPESLLITQPREILEAKIHYLRNTREVVLRHPDSLRKWTDPKKTLYDGTRVWNDDGTPAIASLAEQKNKFMVHGDGGDSVHEFRGFVHAMKGYQRKQTLKAERQRPPKNRVKSEQEVAEYLALKNKQREESRRRHQAIDDENARQFQEAVKRRHAGRQ